MLNLALMASVFVFAFAAGYVLIGRVPPRLHTPLMSMTNAISGVTILGGILLFAAETSWAQKLLGGCAIALAAFNCIGGFAITDRMIRLLVKKGRSP